MFSNERISKVTRKKSHQNRLHVYKCEVLKVVWNYVIKHFCFQCLIRSTSWDKLRASQSRWVIFKGKHQTCSKNTHCMKKNEERKKRVMQIRWSLMDGMANEVCMCKRHRFEFFLSSIAYAWSFYCEIKIMRWRSQNWLIMKISHEMFCLFKNP